MTLRTKALPLFILTLFPWGFALGATPAEQAFAELKTLQGEWKFKDDKTNEKVTYEVRADGHALVETLYDMVTVYHLDGDSILMTHYCSAGNQPRTRATQFAVPLKNLEFKFVDVTNSDGHGHYINGLVLTWDGPNKLHQVWKSKEHDGTSGETTFDLERIR